MNMSVPLAAARRYSCITNEDGVRTLGLAAWRAKLIRPMG
jgi:hypothetical protein